MIERPPHLGLRHVALYTTAYDQMKQFYVERLGFAIEWEPDGDNVYLSSGSDNLALHREAGDRVLNGGPLDHIGLIVPTADDVDRWATYLGEHGIALQAAPRTHRDGARSLYVRDPDGNIGQIIHHPPIS